jgi:hypothetical protein
MLWSICWRLSRRRSEYVVRGPELEPVRREEGNVREMAKKKGDRVKEIVSELDIWIWIRIRNRLDCIVHTLIHECVVFTIDSWSFGIVQVRCIN